MEPNLQLNKCLRMKLKNIKLLKGGTQANRDECSKPKLISHTRNLLNPRT